MAAIAPSLPSSAPAEERFVRAEPAELPVYSDDVWTGRYVPLGVLVPFRGQIGTPAPYALDTQSLVVRQGERELRRGVDYLLDPVYATICLPVGVAGPMSVSLDYRYTLLRIDSIVVDATTSRRRLIRGVSHLTNPHPPRLADGEILEANLLIDRLDTAGPAVFVPRAAGLPWRAPDAGARLSGAAKDLADGEGVRLLFLGDSITDGGDASTDQAAFREVAARRVRDRHPGVQVRHAATGGSRSMHWLDPEDQTCDWGRVVVAAPDVTVIEFLNDAYLDPADWKPVYDELVARLRALGSEVVLLTPTFAMRAAMDGSDDADDGRPYVRFVREYAANTGLPLIDVSARWERLRDEALPYWTLLANGINHPDDRGHRLTGEFIGEGLLRLLGDGDPA